MESKTLKAIGIVFIGLLILMVVAYVAIAFIKAEANPFMWSQPWRVVMVSTCFCYLLFVPLMVSELKYDL
jgi:hypothetical protein